MIDFVSIGVVFGGSSRYGLGECVREGGEGVLGVSECSGDAGVLGLGEGRFWRQCRCRLLAGGITTRYNTSATWLQLEPPPASTPLPPLGFYK